MTNETIIGNFVCINARACTNEVCHYRGKYNEGFHGSFYCKFGEKEVYCIEKKRVKSSTQKQTKHIL